jgi:hypothetical protein
VNNLNLEIFINLPNILVTDELYGLRAVVEMAQDKWRDALQLKFLDIIMTFFTPCVPIIYLFFFIVHIRYIILVRGSKYGYNTGCETAYTK